MAGLQTIINNAQGLSIDRRKVVGLQITNNEIPRTTQTPTKQPWRFVVDMPASLRYNEARSLMEALDTIDRVTPEIVTFSNASCISWIFKYQGELTVGEIANITVDDFTGNQLTLGNLPAITGNITANTVIFQPNDLLQIGAANAHPYPFTSTTQILRGSGSNVVVTTNRPNILSANTVGNGIIVGNDCQFNVFCSNMPTYKLIPGGAVIQNGTVVNNALLEFSDAFQLYEYVGDA